MDDNRLAIKKSGQGRCKVCNHPGRREVEVLLLNGVMYKTITEKMKKAFPGEPILRADNLSRHKTEHLLTQPIRVEDADGAVGYLIGHLVNTIEIPKNAIPKETVSVPDALKVIINAGIRNIAHDPGIVTPVVLMTALDLARKLGLGGKEQDEFSDAWKELGKKRGRRKKTTVKIEEEEYEHSEEDEKEQPTIIDVTPTEWSTEELEGLNSDSTA